jgi:hypothetical protein
LVYLAVLLDVLTQRGRLGFFENTLGASLAITSPGRAIDPSPSQRNLIVANLFDINLFSAWGPGWHRTKLWIWDYLTI